MTMAQAPVESSLNSGPLPTGATGPVSAGSVLWLLRVEGLAVVVLATILYWRTGASWWLFWALWLLPDLSMLGYLAGPVMGARCYNAVHSYLLPAVLAALGVVLHRAALLPIALIWFHHIGADRLLGYGLKYPEGFGFTHLSQLGKR